LSDHTHDLFQRIFDLGKMKGKLELLDEQLMDMLKTKSLNELKNDPQYITWKSKMDKIHKEKEEVVDKSKSAFRSYGYKI
jgi:hypothetical protein